jgi:GAF domain-containing protein
MPEPETSERPNGDSNPLPSNSTNVLSTESVLDALNLILAGAPLTEILKSIVSLIERHSEGMICLIFLVERDGVHLRYAAAPSLPESYRIATDGATIGPKGGPCSLASHRREAVFVADFQSDPRCTISGTSP